MAGALSQLAFIGPGGPEFLVVMLVLIMVFGAKDAPKIFRKINEILSQVRSTADSFKREIMYGDLNTGTSSVDVDSEDDHYDYSEDYEDEDYGYFDENDERDYSDETFQNLEKDLEEAESETGDSAERIESDAGNIEPTEGEDDVQKN